MTTTSQEPRFRWRAFTSHYILISFVIMIISGVILFMAPPGRIAHWTKITILGLTKTQWQAVHTVFTFLFIIATGFHLFFNWKTFIFFLRERLPQKIKIRREFITAGVVSILVFIMILYESPPFSHLISLGEDLTDSWAETESEPPVPHAELLTLDEFARRMGTETERMMQLLSESGLQGVEVNKTISRLAGENDLAPVDIYNLLPDRKQTENRSSLVEGGGYGRMTVSEIAGRLKMPVDSALHRLKRNHITAETDTKIRDLASTHGVPPVEIVRMIEPDEN